jgi:hypothetical protein
MIEEAELQAELVRAWLAGYGRAISEACELLGLPAAGEQRLSGGGRAGPQEDPQGEGTAGVLPSPPT